MAKTKHFFSEDEEKNIINAITEAEKETSGEIRLHIESKCAKDVLERAKEVFEDLKMHNTRHRNGVLVYIATEDKKMAIYGDEGIHDHVGQSFWDDTMKIMADHFKSGKFETGIIEVVTQIGHKLKSRFPHQEDDVNELKNDISYDDPED